MYISILTVYCTVAHPFLVDCVDITFWGTPGSWLKPIVPKWVPLLPTAVSFSPGIPAFSRFENGSLPPPLTRETTCPPAPCWRDGSQLPCEVRTQQASCLPASGHQALPCGHVAWVHTRCLPPLYEPKLLVHTNHTVLPLEPCFQPRVKYLPSE